MRRLNFKVRGYRDKNRPRWKYVVSYREAGQRKTRLFEKKAQAQAWAAFKKAEAGTQGMEHAEFSTDLRVMAQNALEALRPFGKTIDDAVEQYVAHLKASERSCGA